MRPTTQPWWVHSLLVVVGFGLYCGVVSALMIHLLLHVAPTDAMVAIPPEQHLPHVLTPELARSPAEHAAGEPPRVVMAIAVRYGSRLSFTFSCETTPDRVSTDVLEIPAEEFGDLYRNLGCNQPAPESLRD